MDILSGCRVLDITHRIAGPFCTKLLSQLGAEVAKVERPDGGDPARRWPPFYQDEEHPERSGTFVFLNTSKKSVTLNFKTGAGQDILKRLAGKADIVVESFRPGVAQRYGFDYENLKQLNPSVVMTSLSNYGQTGLRRDWKATELTFFALSGLAYSSYGDGSRAPLRGPYYQAEFMAGLCACGGTLMALFGRLRTKVGQLVDVSILDSIIQTDEHGLVMPEYEGRIKKRTAGRLPASHPFTMRPCKDGYIAICVSGVLQWKRLCLLSGLDQWAEDGSPFLDGKYRAMHAEEVDKALEPWLMAHTQEELFNLGRELLLPFGRVNRISEVMGEEHFRRREFFRPVSQPGIGNISLPGFPFKLNNAQARVERAPALGEHNAEIYGEWLGMTEEELGLLRQQGVI